MDRPLAKAVLDLTYKIDRDLVRALRLVQEQASEEEFRAFRKKVAPLVAGLFLDVMDPLFREHLELVPSRYRDQYESAPKAAKGRRVAGTARRKREK